MDTFEDTVLYSKELDVIKSLKLKDFKNSGTIVSTELAMCPMCGKTGSGDTNVLADIVVQQAPDDPSGKVITSFIGCGYCKKNLGWGFKVME